MSSAPKDSVQSNPAVFRCCRAWDAAYNARLAETTDMVSVHSAAENAYLTTMPPVHGTRNIRNFIACVAYASLIGVIEGDECSRLLYAAQVAHTTRRTRKSKAKAGNASSQKSHSGAIQGPISAIKEAARESANLA